MKRVGPYPSFPEATAYEHKGRLNPRVSPVTHSVECTCISYQKPTIMYIKSQG